jgi:hypothetical protein
MAILDREGRQTTLTCVVPAGLAERVDEYARAMSPRTTGGPASRADAIRELLLAALGSVDRVTAREAATR